MWRGEMRMGDAGPARVGADRPSRVWLGEVGLARIGVVLERQAPFRLGGAGPDRLGLVGSGRARIGRDMVWLGWLG